MFSIGKNKNYEDIHASQINLYLLEINSNENPNLIIFTPKQNCSKVPLEEYFWEKQYNGRRKPRYQNIIFK